MPISKETAAGLRITVAGGGISGLAAAAAFGRRGASVTVFEQAAELAEVGAGLQISPNGVAVLDALGLGRQAREIGLGINAIVLRDGITGKQVARLPLRHLTRPYLAFHRADLLAMLEGAARDAGARIELGRRIESDPTGQADLTVAADGVRSVFRARLNGASDPFFTGQVAWRALVPLAEAVDPVATVFMGPHCHIVAYPLRGGTVMNLVAVEEQADWTEADWNLAGDPDDLRQRFCAFSEPATGYLSRISKVHKWGLFRHPVAEIWQSAGQRLALAGDAAHPTLPFLAQGANMGLEDAWMLANRVSTEGVTEGLPTYQKLRRPRVVRAIETANANARNYHLSNPVTRMTAHAGLRLLGNVAPGLLTRRFEWLYGYDVTEDASRP